MFLLLLAAASSAQAADVNLLGGASATSGVRWTPVLFADVAGSPADDGHAHWEPVASVGGIESRNTDHENLDHTVFLAAAGARYGGSNGLFFSEQIAATSTRTDALSSRFEFMTSLGWQHGHFIALVRHISNAHLLGAGKNLGETMALVGVRI
ncbi:MAG TPA: lipid A 3-O-deacylase, partial [Rhodanobacteraceae bacterium]|nr:lipid A 3-O-deacylase [Rhodanobacteraceae bacterium]